MKALQNNPYDVTQLYLLPVLFFLAIVGVGIYAFGNSAKQQESLANSSLSVPLPRSLLPVEHIKSLATAEAPDTAITKIKLERGDKQLVYVVSLADDSELVFDAQSGKKLSQTDSDDDQPKTTLPAVFSPSIDFDSAREIALASIPDGEVSQIELKSDDDSVIYSVHFTDGSSVDIAATDGTVVRTTDSESTTTDPIAPATDTPGNLINENNQTAPAGETPDTNGQSEEPTTSTQRSQTNGGENF